MRLLAFLFEQLTKSCRRVELLLRDPLPAQVGLLVGDEVERELVAVLPQKPACEELVDLVEREGMRADEARDVGAQPCRVTQPSERLAGEACAAFGVIAVGARLTCVVQESA